MCPLFAGFMSACRLIQGRSNHPMAVEAGQMVLQVCALLAWLFMVPQRTLTKAAATGVVIMVAAKRRSQQ